MDIVVEAKCGHSNAEFLGRIGRFTACAASLKLLLLLALVCYGELSQSLGLGLLAIGHRTF